jgi:hypothetical protein
MRTGCHSYNNGQVPATSAARSYSNSAIPATQKELSILHWPVHWDGVVARTVQSMKSEELGFVQVAKYALSQENGRIRMWRICCSP